MLLRILVFALPFVLSAANPERALEVLETRCSQCHSQSMRMSGLSLASREELLKGGTRGTALVPGASAKSRLYQAMTHQTQPAMPPGKKLGEDELSAIREWIDAGATWPLGARSSAAKPSTWWAFQKPAKPEVPDAAPGQPAHTPIDKFIQAKLRQQGLQPAPEATRQALIRRAYFDLHGLPPTPEEVRSFVNDQSSDAYEKLIDSLLASPRYGEKWGRHWLDLVRYGDTSGFEQDPYNLEAWRFRDWVIQSINEDKPYDRFVKEQLAGDELWPDDAQARCGTGYFCVGANRDMLFKVEELNKVETLADYVDTTSSVFLGLSVGCARCHDHKFDPIPQKDYYRMQAIFAPAIKTRVFLEYNTARFYDIAANSREIKLRQIGEEIERLQAPSRRAIIGAKAAKIGEAVRAAFAAEESQRTPEQQRLVDEHRKTTVKASEDEVRAAMSQEDLERLHAVEKRLVGLFAGYKPPPMAPGIMDMSREAPRTYVAVRGNPAVRGEQVQPGFPTALGGGTVPEPPETSETTFRRKALAEWIANPDNPLTARVMINRIWQYHFGRGIVATASDYGTRGAKPSHPELLDWLANEFVARGWSMKQMHRLIMTSQVYRQSSRTPASLAATDPENIYLSHMNRRRLQAEEIRDSLLSASGELNLKMGGMPVVEPLDRDELYGIIGDPSSAWVVTADAREHKRRSVYLISRRAFKAPMFELFDAPDGIQPCARRESSTIAPQSLTLLNGRFPVQQAKSLASSLGKQEASQRIEEAWWRVLNRAPRESERTTAAQFLASQEKHLGSPEAALTELARSLFNLNEFLYVD